MAKRRVTHAPKDDDGDIIAIANRGSSWGSVSKQDAIRQIERGDHAYYVENKNGHQTPVKVVDGPTGKYLRTQPDRSRGNNLDDLPG